LGRENRGCGRHQKDVVKRQGFGYLHATSGAGRVYVLVGLPEKRCRVMTSFK
jgi:hypothetical protein